MRRLRDETDAADPDVAGVARLVATVGPLEPAPAREQRVWSAMRREPARRAPRLVWAAVAVALLVGSVAMASTGIYRWRMAVRRAAEERQAAATAAAVEAKRGRRHARGPHAGAVVPESQPASQPASAPASQALPVEEPAPVVAVTPAPTPRRAARPAAAPAAAPAADADETDAALVLRALRALRQERDPARASALLDRYLGRRPTGPLAEHALALAIEAADARGDSRAGYLARDYLARYPGGQFSAVARRAAARFPAAAGGR
jgi:hypothetical protein